MPLQMKEPKEKEVAKKEVAQEKVAEQNTANAEVVEDVTRGEDREYLAFICPLGDPSQQDTTKVTLEDGSVSKKVTSTIYGYKFKVLKDMRIPECGTDERFKNEPMNFLTADKWVDVKAGTVVCLTPFETALLLSQPRFNGGCDGGEKPVNCVYNFKSPKTKNGTAVALATNYIPRVSLRGVNGSIKEFDIEDVLTCTKEVDANGRTHITRTIKPGFEKWIPLTLSKQRKSTGRSGNKVKADPRKVANSKAEMFLKAIQNRK